MSKTYTLVRQCTAPGCKEVAVYEYKSKVRYHAAEDRYHNDKYLCSYHDRAGITPKNSTHAEIDEYVVVESKTGHYFDSETKGNGHGILFGDGWAARPNDFPVGTKLTVKTIVSVVPS